MISLTASLLKDQKARTIPDKHLLLRCVLTYGSTTYTYTKSKIKQLTNTRQAFSNKAELILEDTDKTLHGLDLEGYKAVISRGLITTAGEEWTAMPPMWVVGQQRDSYGTGEGLECNFTLEGIFDRMAKHKADASYTPDSGDTRTVKDWLTEIISLTSSSSDSTVEQATSDSDIILHDDVRYYAGQRLTISDRRVTKLAFQLKKVGSPTGEITFSIYDVDEDFPLVAGDLLGQKVLGDASTLTTSYGWKEVTFDTPIYVNQEVRIVCQFSGGSSSNYVKVAYNASSVLGSEQLTEIYTGNWTDRATWDAVYRYTYSATPITIWDDYPAYGLVFDEEDDLIDSFIPADSFRINLNDTRLQKVKELLRYTDCVARIENDGLVHIRVPVTTGSTYDITYNLVKGDHNFFNKRFRRRVVSPNYIIFKNHPAHSDSYTGFAKDASADLTDMREKLTLYVRATGNGQCTNLANAYLSKLQMVDEKGSVVLPFLHFGQEIYDYVNVVDARAGDSRAGNVGYIVEYYRPGQFNMRVGFGSIPLGIGLLRGLPPATAQEGEPRITAQNLLPLIDQVYSYIEQILDLLGEKADIDSVNDVLLSLYEDAFFRNLTVTERFRGPFGTDKFG